MAKTNARKLLDVVFTLVVLVLVVTLLIASYRVASARGVTTHSASIATGGYTSVQCVCSSSSRKGDTMIRKEMRFSVHVTPKSVTKKTQKATLSVDLESSGLDCGTLEYTMLRNPSGDFVVDNMCYVYSVSAEESGISPFDQMRIASVIARQVWSKDDAMSVFTNPAILIQRFVKSSKVHQVRASDHTVRIPDTVDENLTNYSWTYEGHDYSVYASDASAAARAITLALFDSGNREARIAFMDAGESEALSVIKADSGLDAERAQNVLSKLGLDVDSVVDPARVEANARSKSWNDSKRAEKAAAKVTETA